VVGADLATFAPDLDSRSANLDPGADSCHGCRAFSDELSEATDCGDSNCNPAPAASDGNLGAAATTDAHLADAVSG